MGLTHPQDLEAWHGWQRSRQRVRRLRNSLRTAEPGAFALTTFGGDEPRLLVAADSNSPTSRASLLQPLLHLDIPVAVLSPDGQMALPGRRFDTCAPVDPREMPRILRGLRGVLSLGHYLPQGGLANAWAQKLGVPTFVVQHGALTPHAPPLPPGARLLAWNEADAKFWSSARADVAHEVVGSQLLWTASRDGEQASAEDKRIAPTYLGQLHGAELSRVRLSRAAASFCRQHGATYRPHPSERDRLSRAAHATYRRLGISVDASQPLNELPGPVVSVFSTGVLEAAAQGRSAWVDLPAAPAWLGEFWERYDMHRFGDSPTPAPTLPAMEPAMRIAQILTEAAQ